MSKTERLLTAALAAAAILAESACSDDIANRSVVCTTIDPRTHRELRRVVTGTQTCPPASTIATHAQPATGHTAGWYYYHGAPYYGTLRAGTQPATQAQAEQLESEETASEANARESDAESERESRARGGFGESGGREGFGG